MSAYLFTRRPWREKFSQITERIARMSRFLLDWLRSSQSMRNTVSRNFLVKGKQNLGFSRISSAIIDSTQSILYSVAASLLSSYLLIYLITSSCLPSLVKWFIIFLIRSTQIMNTEEYPFWKSMLMPLRQSSKVSASSLLMASASCIIVLTAAVQSVMDCTYSRRASIGGLYWNDCGQEGQDQVDADDDILVK